MMKSKKGKVFLLAAVLAVNGLLVIGSGSARPMLAEEYLNTEIELGVKMREGDKIVAPGGFTNFSDFIVRYTDENGTLMNTKFIGIEEKSYTIPAYNEISGNSKIPSGKVFDCWELVKKPEKDNFQSAWELRRVLKDIVPGNPSSEEPTPSEDIGPSGEAVPSEMVRPSEAVKPSEETKPSEMVRPSETAKPSEAIRPTETVKPSETLKPSAIVGPSEAAKPSEEVRPSSTVKPSEEIKPSKEPRPSKETKPSETSKPSEEIKSSKEPKPSETSKPSEEIRPTETTRPETSRVPKPSFVPGSGAVEDPDVQPILVPQPERTVLSQMYDTPEQHSNHSSAFSKTVKSVKQQTAADQFDGLVTMIQAGTYNLEAGRVYTLSGALKVDGDVTEYVQGIQFQVKAGGSFTFR